MEYNIWTVLKDTAGRIKNELLLFSLAAMLLVALFNQYWEAILAVYAIAMIVYFALRLKK